MAKERIDENTEGLFFLGSLRSIRSEEREKKNGVKDI